jgi:hypothetical protein
MLLAKNSLVKACSLGSRGSPAAIGDAARQQVGDAASLCGLNVLLGLKTLLGLNASASIPGFVVCIHCCARLSLDCISTASQKVPASHP